MEITYPYKMSINTKEDAVYAITHMCCECPDRVHYCSGAKSMKCNEVKDNIAREFSKNDN